MSEIIILRNLIKNYPLIVASNEEDPNTNENNIKKLSKDIVGRADDKSCLAVNYNSIFATYTKQGITKGKSVNKLITDILKKSSLDEVLEYLKTIDTSEYPHINLIFGNKEKVFVAYSYFCNNFICIEVSGNESVLTQDIIFNRNNVVFNKSSRIHNKISSIRYDAGNSWNSVYKFIKELLKTTKVKKLTRFSTILAFKKGGLSKYKAIDRVKEKVYKDYFEKFAKNNSLAEEDYEEDVEEVNDPIKEVYEIIGG